MDVSLWRLGCGVSCNSSATDSGVIIRLLLTDTGTGSGRRKGMRCPLGKGRKLRQDSADLAKHWRREAKRGRADLELAEQDTIKHGERGYLFSM